MFSMVDCEARVVVNDETISNAVSVGIDPNGNYLYLKVGAKNELFVRPFPPQMITRWDSTHMKVGVDYNFSGTDVGFWSRGPLNHPGDGEFENRHFTSIAIHVAYSPTSIVVALRGNTERGCALYKGQPDPTNTALLPSWKFDVEFSLPRAAMKEFFAIDDAYYAAFERRLDQCG